MAKRIIAVLLVVASLFMCSVAYAAPTIGDMLRFIPVQITVTDNAVQVEGYFVNLSSQYDVMNFTNFDMALYVDGTILADAYFGTINSFTVRAGGTQYQSFTYTGPNGLNNGVYICDDHFYCPFSANFTTRG